MQELFNLICSHHLPYYLRHPPNVISIYEALIVRVIEFEYFLDVRKGVLSREVAHQLHELFEVYHLLFMLQLVDALVNGALCVVYPQREYCVFQLGGVNVASSIGVEQIESQTNNSDVHAFMLLRPAINLIQYFTLRMAQRDFYNGVPSSSTTRLLNITVKRGGVPVASNIQNRQPSPTHQYISPPTNLGIRPIQASRIEHVTHVTQHIPFFRPKQQIPKPSTGAYTRCEGCVWRDQRIHDLQMRNRQLQFKLSQLHKTPQFPTGNYYQQTKRAQTHYSPSYNPNSTIQTRHQIVIPTTPSIPAQQSPTFRKTHTDRPASGIKLVSTRPPIPDALNAEHGIKRMSIYRK